MFEELTPYLVLIGPIALVWNIIAWWIGQRPLPSLGVECKTHETKEGKTICEIMLTVKNRGKRRLGVSIAMVWVLRGISLDDTSRLAFLDSNEVTGDNVTEWIEKGLLVGRESLSHITKEDGVFIDPEEAVSEVIAVHIDEPGVYKVEFECLIEQFPLPWRSKFLIYHNVALFVV